MRHVLPALAEGAARVPIALKCTYVQPQRLGIQRKPNKIRGAKRGRAFRREIVSKMDESASTTDGLGSVDHDGTPGAEPLVESSPGTAAAAAGVEVVSAPNREGNRDRLKQSQREAKHARFMTSRRQPKPSVASVFLSFFVFGGESE